MMKNKGFPFPFDFCDRFKGATAGAENSGKSHISTFCTSPIDNTYC